MSVRGSVVVGIPDSTVISSSGRSHAAVDSTAAALRGPAVASHRELDERAAPRPDTPQSGRAAMAQHGTIPGGEHNGEDIAFAAELAVAQCIDTTLDLHESLGSQSVVDRILPEAKVGATAVALPAHAAVPPALGSSHRWRLARAYRGLGAIECELRPLGRTGASAVRLLLRRHHLELSVLPEVVVVADGAGQPVLAGLERDRLLLGSRFARMERVGAAVEGGLLAVLVVEGLDREVVGEAAGIGRLEVDWPAGTWRFSGRRRYSSRLIFSTPSGTWVYDGPPPHPMRVVAPRRKRAASLRMKGSRMMPGRMTRRPLIALAALSIAAAGVIGCGQEKGDVKQPNAKISSVAPEYQAGAKLFVERCSGCHSLGVVGAEGGALKVGDRERVDGPNFNVRKEDREAHPLRDPQRRLLRGDHAPGHRGRQGSGAGRRLPGEVRRTRQVQGHADVQSSSSPHAGRLRRRARHQAHPSRSRRCARCPGAPRGVRRQRPGPGPGARRPPPRDPAAARGAARRAERRQPGDRRGQEVR